jgi:HD-like signal output (HDOD) protein
MNVTEALAKIAADAASGEVVFPTSANVMLKIQRDIDDPDCSLAHLGQLIAAEPVLSARVVGIANSVAYNPSGQTISDVRNAVARLGLKTLRTIVAAMIVRQMQGMSSQAAYRDLAAKLWEHTAHVASLARLIARRVTRQDPEAAFFAGIVHEVGGFYLIAQAATYPGLLDSDLEPWHGEGEASVGRVVLKMFGVPDLVLEAMETLWSGYLGMPAKTLGDTLLLADQLAPVESPLSKLADIEMLVGDELLTSILKEAEDEVRTLTAALKS